MTIKQLNATDPTSTTVYVDLVSPIAGHSGGRLITVGREYCRILFGNGEVLINCRPDEIAKVRL